MLNLQSWTLLIWRCLIGFSLLNSAIQSEIPSYSGKKPIALQDGSLASLYYSMREAKGKEALTCIIYCNYLSWFGSHKRVVLTLVFPPAVFTG